MKPHHSILFTAIIMCIQASATPEKLQSLFTRMEKQNRDLRLQSLNADFAAQELKSAHSKLYPSMTFTSAVNYGDGSSQDTDFATDTTGGISQSTSSSTTQIENLGNGVQNSVSMSYLVFSQYAVSQQIRRSKNSVKSNDLQIAQARDGKKAQLVGLLLQWQILADLTPQLEAAMQLIGKVREHRSSGTAILSSRKDIADFEEKASNLNYNFVRANEGLRLVESALKDLVPDLKTSELKEVTPLEVRYNPPKADEFSSSYQKNSRREKINDLSIDSAKAFLKIADNDRFFIPSVVWSASASTATDFDGNSSETSTSTTLAIRFGLFDGFNGSARRQQARIGVEASQEKKLLDQEKSVLYLKHQLMEAEVEKAKYSHARAVVAQKSLRLEEIKTNKRRGRGTQLEVSLATLDYAQAVFEQLDALKKHTKSKLDIAVELNEWEKVQIEKSK